MADIQSHKRILNTWTGPVERKILHWCAERMPAWVTSDMLTALGVVGAVMIFLSYWLTNSHSWYLWLASLGLVVNWFGDSMDGTLARYRKLERPQYGFYIDHVVDAYIEILVFLGLGLSPFVRFDLACLALIGYMLLSVLAYVRTCVRGEFAISYGKLGPTEVRLIGISANSLVFFIGNPTLSLFSLALSIYDWLVIGIILLLLIICLATTYHQARTLAELDNPRLRKRQRPHEEPGAMLKRQK